MFYLLTYQVTEVTCRYVLYMDGVVINELQRSGLQASFSGSPKWNCRRAGGGTIQFDTQMIIDSFCHVCHGHKSFLTMLSKRLCAEEVAVIDVHLILRDEAIVQIIVDGTLTKYSCRRSLNGWSVP